MVHSIFCVKCCRIHSRCEGLQSYLLQVWSVWQSCKVGKEALQETLKWEKCFWKDRIVAEQQKDDVEDQLHNQIDALKYVQHFSALKLSKELVFFTVYETFTVYAILYTIFLWSLGQIPVGVAQELLRLTIKQVIDRYNFMRYVCS